VRFEFIRAEKANHRISTMCRVLEVSRSGYYVWLDRPAPTRVAANVELTATIREVHRKSRSTYGSPRVHRELQSRGRSVSRKRVARLMRAGGIEARRKRQFRTTTDSTHGQPVSPNLLGRNFEVDAPNRAWATDITYIRTVEGWLYLAAIIDLFSRRVVGWSMSESLHRTVALDALAMALRQRRPSPGLIHHSDQGCQYVSGEYRAALMNAGIRQSMSRRGDCWDNAVSESFFSTIKAELIEAMPLTTRAATMVAIDDYIRNFYNPVRLHSTNGYISPVEMELREQSRLMAA
jgi:putative transposase